MSEDESPLENYLEFVWFSPVRSTIFNHLYVFEKPSIDELKHSYPGNVEEIETELNNLSATGLIKVENEFMHKTQKGKDLFDYFQSIR